jgi:hypothetical protein
LGGTQVFVRCLYNELADHGNQAEVIHDCGVNDPRPRHRGNARMRSEASEWS